MLWLPKTVLLDVWYEVLELVDQEADNADETSDPDREEAESYFTNVEVVDWGVDKLEDFKEGVVDAVGE